MDSQVKLTIVLNDRFIEIGEEYVVIIIQCRLGNDQKSVIFPGMASDEGSAGIGTCPVRADQFPAQRIFQVNELLFIEFNITHMAL
jgi:hypothetical protein